MSADNINVDHIVAAAGLHDLPASPERADVDVALDNLGVLVEDKDDATRAAVREAAIAALENIDVANATLLIDAALAERPDEVTTDNHGSKSGGDEDEEDDEKSAVTRLANIASDTELWRTPADETLVSVAIDGSRRHWPILGRDCKRWLIAWYYDRHRKPPPRDALSSAVQLLDARAALEGETHEAYLRVAPGDGDDVWLDLVDEEWRAVHITTNGWSVAAPPDPVRFRRSRAMLALPEPTTDGDLDALRRFLRVDEGSWRLLVAWLAMAMRPRGPYPLLMLHGQQGAGKTSIARALRSLVDPNASSVRAEPPNVRDLAIASKNAWVIALDNLSRVRPWLSDGLCRLATGGGFSTRELFTNDDECIFDAMRPIVLTGIGQVAERGDLLERALLVELEKIPEDELMPEADFWRAFEAARPGILGALLTTVSRALRELPGVRLDRLPRMADFAVMGVAVERALGWPDGSFLAAYDQSRQAGHEAALEGDVVAEAIRALAADFCGTATELLERLGNVIPEDKRRGRNWPKSAAVLGTRVTRLMPDLAAVGIHVTKGRRGDKQNDRLITIARTKPSEPSALSETANGAGLQPDGSLSDAGNSSDNLSDAGAANYAASDRSDNSDSFARDLCAPALDPKYGSPEDWVDSSVLEDAP